MNVAEYIIKCPACLSDTRLVSQEANPIIINCRGCGRSIVIHNNTVFTVSSDYVKNLVRRYKSKACGKILETRISEDAQSIITTDRIQELHNLLEKTENVEDFIKKINRNVV